MMKKPQRIMVHAFSTHIEQLNSYVKYLPSIYYSPKATESIMPAAPYTKMCLVYWQNQYDLNQNTIPQDICWLLTVLENIEKLSRSSTIPKNTSNNYNGGNSKTNRNSKKMVSAKVEIPLQKGFQKGNFQTKGKDNIQLKFFKLQQ